MSPNQARPCAREAWWVNLDKTRICVVLRVEIDRAHVIYGQSSPGTSQAVTVKLGSHDGKVLRVAKDTHFRDSNLCFVKLELFRDRIGRCPPSLFSKLDFMAARSADLSYAATPIPEQHQRTAHSSHDSPPSESSPSL